MSEQRKTYTPQEWDELEAYFKSITPPVAEKNERSLADIVRENLKESFSKKRKEWEHAG
jgi:hypothetical protein